MKAKQMSPNRWFTTMAQLLLIAPLIIVWKLNRDEKNKNK